MIRGIGLDMCVIRRMAKAIEKDHFLDRVFTEREMERIMDASTLRRGEIAAGMFAAKEAVAKAFGTGFNGFGPSDIEILPNGQGRPTCKLYNRAEEFVGNGSIFVSITHEDGMAAAVAILEGE